MAKLDAKKLGQPYTSDPAEYMDAMFPVRTTAQLADAADSINVDDKRVGKMVFDSTLGQPVWADTAAATGTWSLSTGVVSTTPS